MSKCQERGFLQSSVGVSNGTASVVVEMALDFAADDTTEGADKLVDLSGGSASLMSVSGVILSRTLRCKEYIQQCQLHQHGSHQQR